MHYPTFGEYADALQLHLGMVLADPLLGRGKLCTHGPRMPIVHGGTFALTFEVVAEGRKYALRCFHKELDALHERYGVIGRYLVGVKGPYFVGFEFQPLGITTESGTYPIVRMDWVDGQSLAGFVAEHLGDVDALQQLRFSLRRLARHLRENGIAHGDIQPTNIIVQKGANLRLIDYDGMFVPGLAPFYSPELGQRNFQHPGRRAWHFNVGLDAFSFAVLDFALEALCKRPELWEQTGSGEDAFVLRAADFADPARSAVFAALSREPGLEQRTRHLAAICMSPFERIPPFEDFLSARVLPELSVELAGGSIGGQRPPYVSPCEVVDATDFAQCCKHIGDRVELVGRVVSVVKCAAPRQSASHVRFDFGADLHDMTCLKIWQDPQSQQNSVPDHTWVGQWVSAVGLVEPVYSDPQSAQGQKYISVSITESGQLLKLTEAEAQYRLSAQRERHGASLAATDSVRTDPVPEAAMLAPLPTTRPAQVRAGTVPTPEVHHAPEVAPAEPALPARAPAAPVEMGVRALPGLGKRTMRPRTQPWAFWGTAAVIALLAAYALLPLRSEREPAAVAEKAAEPVPPPVSLPDTRPAAAPAATSELLFQQDLKAADLAIDTVAGTLLIAPAADDDGQRIAMLNGTTIPGLRDDVIVLAHRAVFADREVVVGLTQCDDTDMPCSAREPFWLELRAGLPAELRQARGLQVGSRGVAVKATREGVATRLGVWNGERRTARLTAAGNLVVERTREPVRPLDRADCAVVAQSLDACAASRDCSSFATSAQTIELPRWNRLTRLYHESTGLDVAAFRTLCVRSCEFGLTPSLGLIRRNACNGAQSDQWATDDPAAGLRR